MKNVTITLEETVAQWARVEAAKAGKSLSRWVGDILAEQMNAENDQSSALEALLSLPLMPLSKNGKLPARSELHNREIFRRYERDRLQPRRKRAREKAEGG